MLPKGGGLGDGGISKLGEVELEAIIHNAAVLFQAWHVFANLNVDSAVGGDVVEVVLL